MAVDPVYNEDSAVEAGRERIAALRAGGLMVVPTLIATATWGLVTGVAMVKSGLTESMALTMTLMLYAGSMQLTSLPLIAASAPVWLIVAAGAVVNLRFLIFGAALHPYFRQLAWQRRLLLGYLTSDIGFVMFMTRYADASVKGTREQAWFFVGAILPNWIVWQLACPLGIYLGAMVPSGWSLDFAAVLALLAITIPLANSLPMLASVVSAGAVAWVGQTLPFRSGLAAAVIVGVAAGMVAERCVRRARPRA
jgi:predicted branched-subunit amino acid permease